MIAKTLKATLKRGSSSVSMEMEIDPPKKPEVGAEAIKNDDFFNAAENGDSSFFEALSHDQLLKALSLRNEDCRSLLHVAASSAHPKVVKILSAADPSVTGINSADEEGWAPLHSASSSGNVEIVEILLSSGADVNLKNNGGRTALHYAASKGWLKIAEILLSHGANINLKDKVGCTPLHRAASTGNSELCELLIEEGAEVDAIDKAGQTPLMSAVICENKEWKNNGWREIKISVAARRLVEAMLEQLILIPYNIGYHSILLVIDLTLMIVYLLDPINSKINTSFEIVINTALKIYETTQRRRTNPVWKVVQSLQQPTNVECGFYVMRYMKDLIGDQSILRKQNCNGKKTYTEIELDEVLVEWINFVLKNMS